MTALVNDRNGPTAFGSARAHNIRPTVFLSYSSRDHEIVARIERDLQLAGIGVWRDSTHVMPGDALSEAIFHDGMSECDHAVVYLTTQSINSPWVKRELDAATTLNAEYDGVFLSLFVDSVQTRDRLTPDLRALNVPILIE